MKKTLIFIGVCALISVFGYIKAEQGDFDTLGFDNANNVSQWRVDLNGHFKPGTASLHDIGTAALPVRNMYVGGVIATSVSMTGSVGLTSKTRAELVALAPGAVGQTYYDSTDKKIVVATGTSAGNFATADGGTF